MFIKSGKREFKGYCGKWTDERRIPKWGMDEMFLCSLIIRTERNVDAYTSRKNESDVSVERSSGFD